MSHAFMSGRIRSKGDQSFSIIPISLPNGCITLHSPFPQENKEEQLSSEDFDESNHELTPCPLNQYNLEEIIFLSHNDYMVDHSWTTTTIYMGTQNQTNLTILAVLGRIKTIGITNVDHHEDNLSTSNDPLLKNEKQSRSRFGSVIRIYCRQEDSRNAFDENEKKQKNSTTKKKEFVLTNEITTHMFLYSLTLTSSALVTASNSGTEVYSLHRLLLNSAFFQEHWPDSRIPSNYSSEKLKQYLTIPNEENDTQQDQWNEYAVNNRIHLMFSFPIHAMRTCPPFLAVASGDQIGVWNLDMIVQYLERKRVFSSEENISNDAKKIFFKEEEVRTAVWSFKVKRCTERITFIDFTQTHLAFCCWDGTAFVFYPSSVSSANHDEQPNEDSTHDFSIHTMTQHNFHKVTSWKLYNPMEASNAVPEWEIPPLDGEDRQKTQNNPVFLSISTFSIGSRNTLQYHSNLLRNEFIALTTPGSNIIRFFDLRNGRNCLVLGKKSEDSILNGGAVHGIISINSKTFPNVREIFWIDEKDIIHSRVWPHRKEDRSTIQIQFRNLLYRKEGFTAQILFENILYNQLKFEGWLKFHPDENIWKLDWTMREKKTGRDEEQKTIENIPLPFLTDDDAIDLTTHSKPKANKNEYPPALSSSNPAPCSAIACTKYLGIIMPALEVIYILHFHTKSWIPVDIDDYMCDEVQNANDQKELYCQHFGKIKAWFIDTKYLIAMFSPPSETVPLTHARVSVWNLIENKYEQEGSTDLSFAIDNQDDGLHEGKLNERIQDTIQLVPIDNSNSLSILFFCKSQFDGANTNMIWIYDVYNESNPVIKPQLVNIEHIPNREESAHLLGATRQVINQSSQFLHKNAFLSLMPDKYRHEENTTISDDSAIENETKNVVLFFSWNDDTERVVWSYFVNLNVWKRFHGNLDVFMKE